MQTTAILMEKMEPQRSEAHHPPLSRLERVERGIVETSEAPHAPLGVEREERAFGETGEAHHPPLGVEREERAVGEGPHLPEMHTRAETPELKQRITLSAPPTGRACDQFNVPINLPTVEPKDETFLI